MINNYFLCSEMGRSLFGKGSIVDSASLNFCSLWVFQDVLSVRNELLPALCIPASVMLACQPALAPTLPDSVVISLEGVRRETQLHVQEQKQTMRRLWGVLQWGCNWSPGTQQEL